MKLAASRSMIRRLRSLSTAAGLLGCSAPAFAADRPASADADAPDARSADFRIISGSEAVIPVSIEAGAVIVDVR
jgi:hypothetical protein